MDQRWTLSLIKLVLEFWTGDPGPHTQDLGNWTSDLRHGPWSRNLRELRPWISQLRTLTPGTPGLWILDSRTSWTEDLAGWTSNLDQRPWTPDLDILPWTLDHEISDPGPLILDPLMFGPHSLDLCVTYCELRCFSCCCWTRYLSPGSLAMQMSL